MNRINAILITAALVISVSAFTACKNEETPPPHDQSSTELEQTQQELEQIKQDSSRLDAYIADLKNEINSLKIENQKLIAQSKRLEAEIIDLKLELGEIPDSDSTDELDKDSAPADSSQNTGTDATATPGSTSLDDKGGMGEAGALHKVVN